MPTLKEEGVDVEITNWRGIVAPPGISADEEQALEDLVSDMTESDSWQSALDAEGWGDVLQCGPEFESFVESETKRTDQIVEELGIGEVS